jgi:CMP-N,N'-diacetyllegionaminic acid synthase
MLAIIPARGGSKGLPRKNSRNLNGLPLIAYSIIAAQNSNLVSRIIVSTDDEEIAMIALKYGAEVPFFRPSHLASDTALSLDVYEYTIERLASEENIKIEEFIVLQPTSPLRESEDINKSIELFREKKAFSVVSFCQEHHPISWHKFIEEEGRVTSIFEDKLQNRQEFKPTFFPNGAIFVLRTEVFKTRKYYTEDTYAYIMDRRKSVDIDTLEDFEYAEFLLKKP